MEARVGVVVEGGQRALNTAHSSVVDASARKFLQQPQQPQHNLSVPKRSLNQHQAQIGTVQQLLAGGIAGAFSKTCTAPLARLTILFQVFFCFLFFGLDLLLFHLFLFLFLYVCVKPEFFFLGSLIWFISVIFNSYYFVSSTFWIECQKFACTYFFRINVGTWKKL